jgi:plastocyanin
MLSFQVKRFIYEQINKILSIRGDYMKKIILIFLVVVFLIFGCTVQQKYAVKDTSGAVIPEKASVPAVEKNTAVPTETKTITQKVAELAKAPLTANVMIKGFAFTPNPLKIKAGTTVIWTNQDSAPHLVKFDSFESDTLSNGGSYEHRFDTAGTYDYSCGIHPSMKGQIVVQ